MADAELMAELEQLRAQVKHLNPAGHSVRNLLLEDVRRRNFIDRLMAEAEQLRASAAADHDACRVAVGLPKSWPMLGKRCHFVAMVPAGEGVSVVVYRHYRSTARGWAYEAKPLWMVQAARGQDKGVLHG